MKFYAPKKKPVNVPILSLLDILAILLIYTVVSSKFVKEDATSGSGGAEGEARKQAALRVDTPSTDSLPTKNVKEKRIQIVLAADGQISFAGSLISKDLLVTYLGAMNADAKLEVKADKEVTLEQWVFMLESLKKAGIPASDVPWLIKDKSKKKE